MKNFLILSVIVGLFFVTPAHAVDKNPEDSVVHGGVIILETSDHKEWVIPLYSISLLKMTREDKTYEVHFADASRSSGMTIITTNKTTYQQIKRALIKLPQ